MLAPPVGTTWLFEQDGEFEVPATGQYEIEMHGSGSGAKYIQSANASVSGSGSGEIYVGTLNKSEKYPITIGLASDYDLIRWHQYGKASDGGSTSFGSFTISGAVGGSITYFSNITNGTPYGSLATAGQVGISYPVSPGLGNKNKPDQKYGNGAYIDYSGAYHIAGNGVVIITYLGK